MKLPSLQTLWNGFRNVLVRFPIQSIIVLLAGGLWLGITYAPEKADQEWADKIIILCNLAFTLSLSANLFSEINHYSRPKSLIIQLAALVPATILFFILEPSGSQPIAFEWPSVCWPVICSSPSLSGRHAYL